MKVRAALRHWVGLREVYKISRNTIPYLLKRAAFKYPDREAIISESGRWSYKRWEQNSNKRAHALARHGIKKGNHVATLFFNDYEVLETFLALLKLGTVIAPLNVHHSLRNYSYDQTSTSRARFYNRCQKGKP